MTTDDERYGDTRAWLRLRVRTADVLFAGERGEPITHRVDLALIVLISLNVIAVVLQSVQTIYAAAPGLFHGFEVFSVIVFTGEYLARTWSSVDNPWKSGRDRPVLARIRYMLTKMAIIDLIAIAPFYLGMFMSADLRILRALRLLRIFKLTRYSSAMTLLLQVVREEARTIGAALFVAMLLVFVASTLAFIVEHEAQPKVFSSIPMAMYWAVVTMTTVGYGDMVPVTAAGKVLGGIIGIIGLGMVALPAGILASGFNNALHRRRAMLHEKIVDAMRDGRITAEEQVNLDALVRRLNLNDVDARAVIFAVRHQMAAGEKDVCPHCGKPIHDAYADDDIDNPESGG
ncbi:MAG: ion transporter [Alphaproteobacteria bacterium]|nr:ion transporter [Alphaproteobacteria bacterium]